jgi:hypothetical protein
MLLGHDLGWWSFALTIFGLILMFPAAIIANIVTTKLQNWWAQRSLSSLKRRIDKIEAQLSTYESKYGLISDVEELTLYSLIAVLFGLSELTLFGSLILMYLHVVIRVLTTAPTTPKILMEAAAQHPMQLYVALALIALVTFLLMYSVGRISGFLSLRGPIRRRGLRASLVELRAKLSSATGG